jgi:O-glycosyl hydrolase
MIRTLAAAAVFILIAYALSAQELLDDNGRLERLPLGGGWQELRTDVVIASKDWTYQATLGGAKPVVERDGEKSKWTATLELKGGGKYAVEQTVRQDGEKVKFQLKVTALEEAETEGAIFWIDLPAADFAGGAFDNGLEVGEFPRTLRDPYHLTAVRADAFTFFPAHHKTAVKLDLDGRAPVLIQDGRKWAPNFSVLVFIDPGTLRRGRSAELTATLSMTGKVDDSPAELKLDADGERYEITGIGGNYCFNLESPVTRYTLDNLRPAFARTEISLDQWEPEDDNGQPEKHDWQKLVRQDTDGSKLRREFEMMRELTAKKIPFAASVWRLPTWMYEKPPKDLFAHGNKIVERHWPDVLECIGTYLQYAKEKYQAEADYFSFNEPDLGVTVQFTPEEHRDAIRKIGAHLKSLGLKTKLLLADVANPRETDMYTIPAAEDKDAMQHVGALAFHSWSGATPKQYADWHDLAEYLKLPLIVAEAGVDPDAWRNGRFQSFDYGLREMAQYQELFLHARPQAVLFWEFTGDYSLLAEDKEKKLQLTERAAFQFHWTQFVPPGSKALKTKSDNERVLFTAFSHRADGTKHHTLQIVNKAWPRKIKLEGIPKDIAELNAVRTSRGEIFQSLEKVRVADGKVELDLPAQCMLTLTTMEIQKLPPVD